MARTDREPAIIRDRNFSGTTQSSTERQE